MPKWKNKKDKRNISEVKRREEHIIIINKINLIPSPRSARLLANKRR